MNSRSQVSFLTLNFFEVQHPVSQEVSLQFIRGIELPQIKLSNRKKQFEKNKN